MANRSRAYNRRMSYLKALRKKKITEEVYWDGNGPYYHPYYNNLHQYSKNKIHCSCPMCSEKTKVRRTRGAGYGWEKGRYNYKHSEKVRQEAMDDDERENA